MFLGLILRACTLVRFRWAEVAAGATGFQAGVTDYLTKPFKPSHLLARLHSRLVRSTGR
jgi:DNA-binding response OmpR family regulator